MVFTRKLSRDERRSSTAQFTDKMRHLLAPLPRPGAKCINDLPIEVLHHVFLNLDFWTLLKCQHVCRLWKDLIPGDSPLLAEVLYLRPSKSLQIYSCVLATFDLDFDIGYKAFQQSKGSHVVLGFQKEFTMTRRCVGLIRTSSEIVFHPIVANFDHYMASDNFRGMVVEPDGKSNDEQVSWKEMLVSMPPLRELALRRGKNRSMYRMLNVREGDEGIKLGDLVQAMDEWAYDSE